MYEYQGQKVTTPIGSASWYSWLETATAFTFECETGTFTARKMRAGSQRGGWYWRAYRRKRGRIATCYLGISSKLTRARLYEAARRLEARLESALPKNEVSRQEPRQQTRPSPGVLPPVAILNTKFVLPRLPAQHVSRPRLLDLLDQEIARPLILVSAPAGFGKTTLLAEWAAATTSPVIWLSCEEADNDPVRFFSYLQAALARLDIWNGTPVQKERCPSVITWEQMMTDLLNDLTHFLQQDTVLILDDSHLLTSETVHTMLQFLLDHLPPYLHLVIGTRVDPPLSLARLRARNQMSELRTETLCFVPSEVEAFVQTMRLALSDEGMQLLVKRTGGWIAAIQLLTLALRGRTDTTEFLQQANGRHRFVREYVSEEILGQQPAEIQRFLLSTCLLRQMCGPLCDVVLGEAGSKDRLEQLRTANLFINTVDEEETWYRYHPFFAEALSTHLRTREPERIPELYRRASLWYEEQHQEEEACEYALLADDQPRAAALLEKLMPRLFERGEFVHMRVLLSQLSPDLVTASPLLSLVSIWAQRFNKLPLGDVEQSTERLASLDKQQIQELHRGHAALRDELPEVLPLLQSWAAMAQGDTERSITLANQTPAASPHPENALNRFLAESRRVTLGALYRVRGDLEAAEQVLLEASPQTTIDIDAPQLLPMAPTLVTLYEARGQLRALGHLYDNVFQQFAQRENEPSLYLALMQARQANLLYEWNQLSEAKTRAQQAQESVQRLNLPISTVIPFLSSWVQARVAFALRNVDQARQLLTQAELELAMFPPLSLPQFTSSGKRHMETFSVRFGLMQGQFEQAERWEVKHKIRFDDRLPFQLSRHDYIDYMTLARILLARGRFHQRSVALKEALFLLEQLRVIAVKRNMSGWSREIQVLTALTMLAYGQTTQALSTLGTVLVQAEPEGYVRLFADEGYEMAYLLAHIAPYTTASPGYIQLIQAAFDPALLASANRKPPTSHQHLPEPLSPREQEVLQLVALGLSNQQIAQELVISLHTVKLHLKHLLAKLAVNNRTQAVARARELHLL